MVFFYTQCIFWCLDLILKNENMFEKTDVVKLLKLFYIEKFLDKDHLGDILNYLKVKGCLQTRQEQK